MPCHNVFHHLQKVFPKRKCIFAALATTDLTGSVVPSLAGLSAIPTRSTGAAPSMASVEAPRYVGDGGEDHIVESGY